MATRKAPPTTEPHVERPGPAEFRDPLVRREIAKAAVWLGMALAIVGVIVLAQPLLLIVGGAIFAVFLDGGARLLGRLLPLPRAWRLLLTLILGFGFLGWVFWFAGTTIAAQAEALRIVVTEQFNRVMAFVASLGLMPTGQPTNIGSQLLGSVGRLTTAVGSAIGAVASFIAMLVIGIFLAAEPRIYDRGIAWMLPVRHRAGIATAFGGFSACRGWRGCWRFSSCRSTRYALSHSGVSTPSCGPPTRCGVRCRGISRR